MKKLKMNEFMAITKEEALRLLSENSNLLSEFSAIHAEECENHEYYLVKVGRKGSIFLGHPDGPEKAENGVFAVVVRWNYIHGRNFSLNRYGFEKEFRFVMFRFVM